MAQRIKKGDHVKIIAGSGKGNVGEVLQVFPERDLLLVDKVKLVTKHLKAQMGGGIIKKESPIHISNVRKVDAADVELNETQEQTQE